MELSKEKSSLKQAESQTHQFLKTLGHVESRLSEQINYLTQVSTGIHIYHYILYFCISHHIFLYLHCLVIVYIIAVINRVLLIYIIGQPHEGSGYASQKVLQMAWHRLEHARSRVNELERIKNKLRWIYIAYNHYYVNMTIITIIVNNIIYIYIYNFGL